MSSRPLPDHRRILNCIIQHSESEDTPFHDMKNARTDLDVIVFLQALKHKSKLI